MNSGYKHNTISVTDYCKTHEINMLWLDFIEINRLKSVLLSSGGWSAWTLETAAKSYQRRNTGNARFVFLIFDKWQCKRILIWKQNKTLIASLGSSIYQRFQFTMDMRDWVCKDCNTLMLAYKLSKERQKHFFSDENREYLSRVLERRKRNALWWRGHLCSWDWGLAYVMGQPTIGTAEGCNSVENIL